MMHRLILVLALLLCVLQCVSAFRPHVLRFSVASKNTLLHMSDGQGTDPLEAIRVKMAADPSYNPMSDPEAMQVLESMIPQEMKDLPNAVERLKVAFTDATTGVDAIENIDTVAKDFDGDKASLLSSPSSKFFTSGQTAPTDFSENEKADLFKKLREEYPDVPPPGQG